METKAEKEAKKEAERKAKAEAKKRKIKENLAAKLNKDLNFTGKELKEKELVMLMEENEREMERQRQIPIIKKDALVKAMNLSHLKPQGKFMPIFTKKLKDPNQLIKDGILQDINFDVKNENRRQKLNRKISSSKVTAAALNLFVHKVETRDHEIKHKGNLEFEESKPNSTSRMISKTPDDSISKSSKRNKPERKSNDENKNNLLMGIMPQVNILSSIGSDNSDEPKTGKQRMELNSNRDNRVNDELTDINRSANVKESSVVLSDLGISIGEDEKDIAETNQLLK